VTLMPAKIERTNADQLQITWSDGQVRVYTPWQLRDGCPCATCRETRAAPPPPVTELPILSPAEAQPLRVAGMKPVGNYAYSINFSDGHNTGIYSLQLLHELGTPVA
jgi:DUF971 family protein